MNAYWKNNRKPLVAPKSKLILPDQYKTEEPDSLQRLALLLENAIRWIQKKHPDLTTDQIKDILRGKANESDAESTAGASSSEIPEAS